jgi:hypothetical protein
MQSYNYYRFIIEKSIRSIEESIREGLYVKTIIIRSHSSSNSDYDDDDEEEEEENEDEATRTTAHCCDADEWEQPIPILHDDSDSIDAPGSVLAGRNNSFADFYVAGMNNSMR